jgi:soluble lytic murein transglycosylase-like protein
MKYLLDKYEGDSELALAAYNMGEGNMAKYGNDYTRVPETSKYIERYRERYGLPDPPQRPTPARV